VLLSATKGIELPSLSLMSGVLRETTPAEAVGALLGPNITPEIMEGQPTTLLVASPSAAARALAAGALAGPRLRVEGTDDLPSHELAGVLKNVVAIAVGMAAGRGMGFNAQGLVFARGLAEIEALGARLGAAAGAFRGIGGAGDLFLTASSPQSLNRRLGVELGSGTPLGEVLRGLPEVPEGIGAVRACRLLARREGLDLPLAEAAARVLEGEEDAGVLERVLMQDPPGASR
jgi:glycerol-3-phosphate dehydrogenase (NAD(P)+)